MVLTSAMVFDDFTNWKIIPGSLTTTSKRNQFIEDFLRSTPSSIVRFFEEFQ